jgi:hypothetical protein
MSARTVVRLLAAPAIVAVRELYVSRASDPLRVAALVDVAGSAATLARTIARLHHIDPASVAGAVSDPVDLYAALGRGQWLPAMTRHVAEPPTRLRAPRRRRPEPLGAQVDLLPVALRGGGR